MLKTEVYKGYRNEVDEPGILESKKFINNEYIVYDNNNSICRYDSSLKDLVTLNTKLNGIKPRNIQQKMAIDLLNNKMVPVKGLVGIAGGGKTYLAIQFAIQALKDGDFEKIFVVRQPEPVGKDIGFLKGTKDDKLSAWFKPVMDNLDEHMYSMEALMASRRLEFDIPGHMQGRTIDNAVIILDEAQLVTKEQMKMIGERVGKNSIFIICGDVKQTLVNQYKHNNGLEYVINELAGNRLFGMVLFNKSERSDVAEMFAQMGGLYDEDQESGYNG
jgi:PhoH-like ATPase